MRPSKIILTPRWLSALMLCLFLGVPIAIWSGDTSKIDLGGQVGLAGCVVASIVPAGLLVFPSQIVVDATGIRYEGPMIAPWSLPWREILGFEVAVYGRNGGGLIRVRRQRYPVDLANPAPASPLLQTWLGSPKKVADRLNAALAEARANLPPST